MDILFCRVNFSKKYSGIDSKETNLINKFYEEKKGNNPEIYNFQDYNGYCYGYVPIKDGTVNLSSINFKKSDEKIFKNALIIWLCKNENLKKDVVIGWYKDAYCYKYLQKIISYPTLGRDLYFNFKARAKNCFLLPEKERTLSLKLNFKHETNVYVPIKEDETYLKKVIQFINNYNKNYENIVFDESLINSCIKNAPNEPKILIKRAFISMYNFGDYLDALKFFNTALKYKDKLNQKEILDIYYYKGLCLQFLNCFKYAILEFEKLLKNSKQDFDIEKNLVYLYLSNKDYEKGLYYCEKILVKELDNVLKNEIICLKIDCLIGLGEQDKLILELNNLYLSTDDIFLKNYCEKILVNLKN